MPKYVMGYMTDDGKFFEEHDDAVLHEDEFLFSELYNELARVNEDLPTPDCLLEFLKEQTSSEMLNLLISILRVYCEKIEDPDDPKI